MPLTQERLREVLDYDQDTGRFVWKAGRTTIKVGKPAGTMRDGRYLVIGIDGAKYYAHRLAWLYVHGAWPGEVDHINRDKIDNRLSNLREVTRAQNMRNVPARGTNQLGAKGVSKTSSGTFTARICVDRKKVYLGCFPTIEAASEKYAKAAQIHHGEFAVTVGG